MQFFFIDTNPKVTEAWQTVFEGIAGITIHTDSIFNHPCDALVSPANSFGYMNGGIDFAISKNLGWHIEKRLQATIREKYYGELLVGQAEIVETDQAAFPYLIAAPTMRTPMTIHRTPNIYLCMKAILTLAMHGKFSNGELISTKVQTIAIPGLGTGVGQMPPMITARHMRIAWEDVMQQKHLTEEGWLEMQTNYAYFYTQSQADLKYPMP